MGNENSYGKSPSFKPSPQESTRYSDRKVETNNISYHSETNEQPSFGTYVNNSHFGFNSEYQSKGSNPDNFSNNKNFKEESNEREGFIRKFRKSFERSKPVSFFLYKS